MPEPKTVKNRLHLDIRGDVESLQSLGATVIARFDEDHGSWTVMADPEGNEFCVIN